MYNPKTGKVEFEEKDIKKPETFDFNERLSFKASVPSYHYGHETNCILHFYPFNNSVQIYDLDNQKHFLKRMKTNVEFRELYLGNKLRICGRNFKLVDFANPFTKTNIWEKRTLCILKPILTSSSYGPIITVLEYQDLRISRLTMCRINRKESLKFYHYLTGRAICQFMVEHLVSGASLGLELVGHDAVSRLYAILGPRTPAVGRKVAPHTLRAIYGHTRIINAIHGTVREDLTNGELKLFFPEDRPPPETTARFKDSICAIIKPHIVKAKRLGELITVITKDHFELTALDSFHFTSNQIDEFLERYKGLVQDFKALQESFMEGPSIVVEISGKVEGMDVFEEFHKFCGPNNPIIAREIKPDSLRAKFGCDVYRNAIHCTDVREDAVTELEFFFMILRNHNK